VGEFTHDETGKHPAETKTGFLGSSAEAYGLPGWLVLKHFKDLAGFVSSELPDSEAQFATPLIVQRGTRPGSVPLRNHIQGESINCSRKDQVGMHAESGSGQAAKEARIVACEQTQRLSATDLLQESRRVSARPSCQFPAVETPSFGGLASLLCFGLPGLSFQ
jgi:hypothetical protein